MDFPWKELFHSLGIPETVHESHKSDKENKTAGVLYWMLRDPFASWRRLITYLDHKEPGAPIADRIRSYAEKITGACVTFSLLPSVGCT